MDELLVFYILKKKHKIVRIGSIHTNNIINFGLHSHNSLVEEEEKKKVFLMCLNLHNKTHQNTLKYVKGNAGTYFFYLQCLIKKIE